MRQSAFKQHKKFVVSRPFLKNGAGFTLMEIVVATTIFALVSTAMMSLFSYTLKINRRTEAIRQSTQSMRTFVEGLVKQIRNGRIYYGVTDGLIDNSRPSGVGPCHLAILNDRYYADKENNLRILDTDGADVCFYLADSAGNYVNSGNFSGSQLIMEKNVGNSYVKQTLNPPNVFIDNLAFFIRPVCDPYLNCDIENPNVYNNGAPPKIQPSVSLYIKFRVLLSTGESVTMYYQTSISSNQYDIPSQ